MDRIEEKLENTLKMLVDDPPETMTNEVMAKIRTGKKRPGMLWVAIASALACSVLVVGIVFSTGNLFPKADKQLAVETSAENTPKPMDTYAAKAADEDKAQPPGADNSTRSGSNALGGSGAGQPAERSAKQPESRPATEQEKKELTAPIGDNFLNSSAELPQVKLVSRSRNPDVVWSTIRDKSQVFTRMITNDIKGDKKTPANKKTYIMTVILSRSYYKDWSDMVKNNGGTIEGSLAVPAKGDIFNVTITFEPIK